MASTSGPKEALVTNNSTLEEESRPSTKRKPDALDAENDFGPIKLDGPLHVDDINGADLDGVLCGDIDHGLGDLDDLNIDDYVGTESLEAPKLCPGLSTNTSPVDDDSTISPAFAHGSFTRLVLLCNIYLALYLYFKCLFSFDLFFFFLGTEDFSVPDKGDPVQTAAPNMDICAEIFVKATEEVLQKALEGSDESTILEPQRQEILRGLILMLPSIPQVAFIRETLEKLTSISTEVQEANGGTSAVSARQSEVIAKAESKVASHDNVLKDSADKLLAAIEINDERKKRVASLNFELAEACSALRRSDAEVTRLNLEQSAKQAEDERLRSNLQAAKREATAEVEAIREKISALKREAGSILETLKGWRSVPH